MSTEPDHECTETYRACVESRRARIMEVIADNPSAGPTELAKLANVDRTAVSKILQKNNGGTVLHEKSVKLSSLYKPDVAYFAERNVKAVEAALYACSREQLAYLFAEVLPIFHMNLIRKSNDTLTEDGSAKEA